MHYVYKLTVPGDTQHLYIGTTKDPISRLAAHCSKYQKSNIRNPEKLAWIQNALEQGIEPELEVIARYTDRDAALVHETKLISEARRDPNLRVLNTITSFGPRTKLGHGQTIGDFNRVINSRQWQVTDPAGNTFQITNMKQFCRDNQLDPGTMSQVARGNQDNHKGYRCVKLT